MTTELTKAAQQALKEAHMLILPIPAPEVSALDLAKAVSERATKIATLLTEALTQRPAAQTEREAWVPYLVDRADGVKGHYAIGRWNPRGYREVWNLHSHRWAAYSDDVMSLEEADSLLRQITIPTVRASLPAPQQATPASAPQSLLMRLAGIAAECSDPDTTDALDALIAATQQATPEPVGEPVGTVVHAKLNGQAKPWVTVALNQDADLPDGAKLFTRPAPGVPEVFALLDGIATKGGLHGVDLQYRRLGSCGWPKAWRATLISTPAVGAPPTVAYGDTPQDALSAAAQAKGGEQ